jgi:glycosyltransferase involved in cell wall biosynthesis
MAAKPRICIITTAHEARDDRIYHKQALSLAGAGYEVSLIADWNAGQESGPIRKLSLPKFRGKVDRLVRGTFHSFRLALMERADVYHFHDPELLPLGVALKLCGKRVIYDVHEDYKQKVRARCRLPLFGEIASIIWRAVEVISATLFDEILAADSHIASLFPPEKTAVIANYPPLSFVKQKPADAKRNSSATFRLAYVGGISLERGIGKIVDALKLVREMPVEFHLAGNVADAGLRQRFKTEPQVNYHGILPWEEVNLLLAEANGGFLLLQPGPSYHHCSGEGVIKLWEYLGMGLPVIISDFPKLKRLIETLDAGIAVDPADPAAIAAAIRKLRDEPQLRMRLGQNGRAAVLNDRNWETEAGKLIRIYQNLLAVKP